MTYTTQDRLRTFAERGYAVLPDVVPRRLLDEAQAAINALVAREPPPPDRRGHHFYWLNDPAPSDPLLRLFTASGALAAAGEMAAPLRIEAPRQVQVSLNIPPRGHRPGGPHLDGLTPPEPSGRPGTFTLLAGVFLTDQAEEDTGNLWVWPGTHRTFAAHLRAHGPDALLGMAHPEFGLPEPEQVRGRAGDLLLAHYLLGHNMGGNLSSTVRRVAYVRLRTGGHRERWRDAVQDALLEFAPVRAALDTAAEEAERCPSNLTRSRSSGSYDPAMLGMELGREAVRLAARTGRGCRDQDVDALGIGRHRGTVGAAQARALAPS